MTISVVGAGGHGRDIANIYGAVHGYWPDLQDDNPEMGCPTPDVFRAGQCYIGVNDPQARQLAWARLESLGYRGAPTLWHPTATLERSRYRDSDWKSIVIGAGCYISDTEIGPQTHINYGCMMTRTRIGEFVTLAPGVHGAGDITIGDRVFIGIGATIGNLVTIGSDAIIGAGSVVLKDVAEGQKVLGVWA